MHIHYILFPAQGVVTLLRKLDVYVSSEYVFYKESNTNTVSKLSVFLVALGEWIAS